MRVLSVLIFIIAFAFSLSAQAGNKGGGGGVAVRPPTGATAAISTRKAGGGGTSSGNPYPYGRMNSGARNASSGGSGIKASSVPSGSKTKVKDSHDRY
jgi:hypothetical protein